MRPKVVRLTEDKMVAAPLKLVAAVVSSVFGVALMAATTYGTMSFNAEKLEARIQKLEHADEKANQALEARLEVWNRERRENAAFQARIMEKLDRIERKLGP